MALPKKIEPGANYRVRLSAVVRLKANLVARPGDDVVITGAVLETIKDKVADAEKID